MIKKIIDKYNKIYTNTSIIVDECSMIDKNTARLLELIKCPIIYIGDYCQLPPVNEELSIIFSMHNIKIDTNTDTNTTSSLNCITLKNVERCKNDVTLIANNLRDKIYGVIDNFNLLKETAPDLIIYNKKFSVWIETYVNDIKQKQRNLDTLDSKITNIYDTMALGWTNKCCSYLNKKIRGLLFSEVNNINNIYIIKGDKLLVKTPYYKYENHIYSSNIVYVSRVNNIKYKPLSFKNWCETIIKLNEENQKTKNINKPETLFDINIDNVLDSSIVSSTIKSTETKEEKEAKPLKGSNNTSNILNYFGKTDKKQNKKETDYVSSIDSVEKDKDKYKDKYKDKDREEPNKLELELEKSKRAKMAEKAKNDELNYHRNLFYTIHNLNDIISNDEYEFTDDISLKYNLLVSEINLHNIKNIPNIIMRINAYTKWHKAITLKLFGIPNDRISCKKCAFFVKKFGDKLKKDKDQNNYVSDFISATDTLEFEMQLCDLVSFTATGKCISSNIPILDMSKQNNIESLEVIRNIIKNSYEVKLMLSKQDELELNSINKAIGEEGESGDKNTKYITMSQMFGHYMSHVITSSYLEIDYGYALTVHKSQGSTYDDVYVEYSNILSNIKEIEKNKLLYTAITRGINKLHIYY